MTQRASDRKRAAEITADPAKLSALCDLWQDARGELWITLQGKSMQPALPPGSRLRLQCAPVKVRVGDVVAVRRGASLLVHRVISVEAGGAAEVVTCQGDANPFSDPPVASHEIVGLVVETRAPALGRRIRGGLGRIRRAAAANLRRAPTSPAPQSGGAPSGHIAEGIGYRNTVETGQTAIRIALHGLGQPALDTGRDKQLSPGEWKSVAAIAELHGLAPLVDAGVRASGMQPPDHIAVALRRSARVSEVQVAIAEDQVAEMLGALNAHGIEPIILKGALLAAAYYPSPGLRPFGDIDILVREEDLVPASDALMAVGYFHGGDIWGRDRDWLLKNHHHWVLHRQSCLNIELHWQLTEPCSSASFSIEDLWEHSRLRSFGEHVAREMEPEDAMVYTCVHLAKHQFRGKLRQYMDAAVLAAQPDGIDWKLVWRRAETAGATNDLSVFLSIADTLGIVPLPSSIEPQVCRTVGNLDIEGLTRYAVEWQWFDPPNGLISTLACDSARERTRNFFQWAAALARRRPTWGRIVKKVCRLPQERSNVKAAAAIRRLFGDRVGS